MKKPKMVNLDADPTGGEDIGDEPIMKQDRKRELKNFAMFLKICKGDSKAAKREFKTTFGYSPKV
jgi:hypothetical protein